MILLLDKLTHREYQVLEKMALGMTSKQIGVSLKIVEKTIEAHRSNILSKLGATNGCNAVYNACKLGLI